MKSKLVQIARRVGGIESEQTELTGQLQLWFWCAGCKAPHQVNVQLDPQQQALPKEGQPPLWTWDQNQELPTINPSVRVSHEHTKESGKPPFCCHFMLKSGQQEFLGDCTHALVGKTVALEDMPDWLANED